MTVDTLITGGTLVTPIRTVSGALAIDGDEIVAVGSRDQLPDARETIDATGQLVLPGIIDPHVHVDDHISADTYEHATRAAALGGVTTIIDFAWQAYDGSESPWDEPSTLREGIERKQQSAEDAVVDYTFHGGILREDDAVLEEIPELIEDGITSFKIFTAYDWGLSNGFMKAVMETLAETGGVGLYHTEDDSICERITEELKAAGRSEPTDYPDSRPDYAEAIAANAAARLAVETESKYYGVHTSCEAAAEVLAAYQSQGLIRAETCTHYTALDESVYSELGDLPRIAPPIRPAAEQEALFSHLRQGTLSVVSTDHVAQTAQIKRESKWWEGPYGANGLQTSLPVFHDEAVNKRGFSYPALVRLMSTNPAQTFGLDSKGSLEPGTDADVIIFDPTESYTILAADNASISDHSLYEGREVSGRVTKTFVRGNLVADNQEIVTESADGKFVERSVPEWE